MDSRLIIYKDKIIRVKDISSVYIGKDDNPTNTIFMANLKSFDFKDKEYFRLIAETKDRDIEIAVSETKEELEPLLERVIQFLSTVQYDTVLRLGGE